MSQNQARSPAWFWVNTRSKLYGDCPSGLNVKSISNHQMVDLVMTSGWGFKVLGSNTCASGYIWPQVATKPQKKSQSGRKASAMVHFFRRSNHKRTGLFLMIDRSLRAVKLPLIFLGYLTHALKCWWSTTKMMRKRV